MRSNIESAGRATFDVDVINMRAIQIQNKHTHTHTQMKAGK